jgi:TnpA family transposase
VPVEFLTDERAAAYGCFPVAPERALLERCCFFDDADLELIGKRRGEHSRLGFGLQLATVRATGTFLPDPTDVPTAVLDYVAEQLGVADASVIKRYTERRTTRFEHQTEIAEAYGYAAFSVVADELATWIADRALPSGDGPTVLFDEAVAWLRARQVLLPGLSRLVRLVARVREETTNRLHSALAEAVPADRVTKLLGVCELEGGARVSPLEQWRTGPRTVSGLSMVKALNRVEDIDGLGVSGLDLSAVPLRRVTELGRYGMAAKAPALRRHPYTRKVATLLATARWLRASAIDDVLELFDQLMTAELEGKAERQSRDEKARRYTRLAKDAAKLAAAVRVCFEAREWGEDVPFEIVWDAIENLVPAGELHAAMEAVTEVSPPVGADPDGEWRAYLVERYATVRGFLPLLTGVIGFEATPAAAPVLEAVRALAGLISARATRQVPSGYLDARKADVELIPRGWWQRLALPPDRPEGTVATAGYVFCLLEQFQRHLGKRDIFAPGSTRWTDPRARLLDGQAWQAQRCSTLNALGLPEDPTDLLAGRAAVLDAAWRDAAAGLDENTSARLDERGRLHAAALRAEPDPPSLIDLRSRVGRMLPRVDLPELLLEVMSWHPEFEQAFTAASGTGTPKLADAHVSIAAALTAHSLNVGYSPVIADTPALSRDRLSYIDQNYLRPENYAAANAPLITGQADIPLAQALGGGRVAAVDGMRFVVPIRSIHARPNPKYFGRRKGATWLNLISDRSMGQADKVLSGTPRDSLHLVDLIYAQHGGERPEVVITDNGSYSDVVFGILSLLGFDYRPEIAKLPDTKLWRADPHADYGPLNATARGRLDLDKVRRHWPDILRVVASIHTGTVPACDILRVLSRGGSLNGLGEAIATYGRIAKTLHVLGLVDSEPYRRESKGMRNLQEERHSVARHLFHGRRGQLYQAYREGMEDQLGALGLVLNCCTLWNTFYANAALEQLRAEGYPIREEDVARLSVYQHAHIEVHGHYSFALPDLGGERRPLRDPDAVDDVPA